MPEPTPTPELRLVQQMARSRYWRWMREYLVARREELFREMGRQTGAALERTAGALAEVTRQLDAPELVLAFYRKQAEQAGDERQAEIVPTPAAGAPSWLQDTTSADALLQE